MKKIILPLALVLFSARAFCQDIAPQQKIDNQEQFLSTSMIAGTVGSGIGLGIAYLIDKDDKTSADFVIGGVFGFFAGFFMSTVYFAITYQNKI